METLNKTSKITIPSSDLTKVEEVLGYFSKSKSDEDVFYHLCFVLMVAGTKFSTTRSVVLKLRQMNYYSEPITIKQLKSVMSCLRFYNNKVCNLVMAKEQFPLILDCLKQDISWKEKRAWLVENVAGLGMKTSSHFLRNMGCRELAVIDTHIIKFLDTHQPKSKTDYLEIEQEFLDISKKNGVTPAVLDSYIWKVKSNTDYVNFDY